MKTLIPFLTAFVLSAGNPVYSQTPAEVKEQSLAGHNEWREEVNVPPLQWSEALADSAAVWADYLAKNGCYLANSAMPYGENSMRATASAFSINAVIDAWGFEGDSYNIQSNQCDPGSYCGHYKQIVWENSKALGCAVAQCGEYMIYVCMYNPPGNYQGVRPYRVVRHGH